VQNSVEIKHWLVKLEVMNMIQLEESKTMFQLVCNGFKQAKEILANQRESNVFTSGIISFSSLLVLPFLLSPWPAFAGILMLKKNQHRLER
jgi:hypothetical protein